MLQKEKLNKKEAEASVQSDFYAERKACVDKLKELMSKKHTELAQAELWLQMADIAVREKGDSAPEIGAYLSSAQAQMSAPELPHDAAYADACRRFAPTFAKLGREAYAKQLLQNASML